MKKIFLPFFFLFLSLGQANAQILISIIFGDKLNSEKLEFGLSIGTTSASILNLENTIYSTKLNLGMYFNIKLAQRFWYLHTGAIAKSTFGARNLNPYDLGNPNLNLEFENANVTREFGIINVPAILRYQNKNGWGVEIGPQFSLRTKVDDIFRVDYDGTRDKLLYRNDVSDLYKRITVEGAAGIYKKLRKGEGMTLNLRYQISLYDIQKENNTGITQYHSVICFFFGIPIGKDKKKEEKEATESIDKP